MEKKIIYQIFKADVHFHTVYMIEEIILTSKCKHFFIVVGINNETKFFFEKMFIKNNYTLYKFIPERSLSKNTRLVSKIFSKIFKSAFHDFEIDLLRTLSKLSPRYVILHSNYSIFLYFFFSIKRKMFKIWVCWGVIYAVEDTHNIKQKISKFLYSKIMKSYSMIICTMEPDSKDLNRVYNINTAIFIPYLSNLEITAKNAISEKQPKDHILKILLGNSGRCIDYYYNDLTALKIFGKDDFFIDCMLNYGSTEEQNSELIRNATAIYGDRFNAHTTLISKENYFLLMNTYDIYISSVKTQSGLAAIYLSLLLGKKVFLSGKNYEHLSDLGAVVYHTDKINQFSFTIFSQPLTDDEKKQNRTVISKLLNYNELSLKWENFYTQLLRM